jgi:Trk K+ transport system NAD-binding subunit
LNCGDRIRGLTNEKEQDRRGASIEMFSNSSLVGKTVREAQDYSGGASILAIRKHGIQIIAKPSDETKIEVGDSLIILGQREQLKLLEKSN